MSNVFSVSIPMDGSWGSSACGCLTILTTTTVKSYTTVAPQNYASYNASDGAVTYSPKQNFVGSDSMAWECQAVDNQTGQVTSSCSQVADFQVVNTIMTPTMEEVVWSPWMAMAAILLLSILYMRNALNVSPSIRLALIYVFGAVMAVLFWSRHIYYAIATPLWHHVLLPLDAVFLRLILPNATQTIFPGMIIEQLPHFKLEVALGCSAIELMILFMYLLTFSILLTWKQIQHRPLLIIYGLALGVSIAVNILRISSIGWYGEWLVTQGAAVEPIITAFHHDAGLVLYGAAFVVFCNLLWITNRRRI